MRGNARRICSPQPHDVAQHWIQQKRNSRAKQCDDGKIGDANAACVAVQRQAAFDAESQHQQDRQRFIDGRWHFEIGFEQAGQQTEGEKRDDNIGHWKILVNKR